MTTPIIDEVTITEMLTLAAAADTRFPAPAGIDDPRITAWQAILAETLPEDAKAAVLRIIRRPQLQVMQPGHVLEEVRVLRRERIKAVSESELVPPDDLQPGAWPLWLRAVRRHIADGLPIEDALREADRDAGEWMLPSPRPRRLVGPSVHRTHPALEPGRRGMQVLGSRIGGRG